MTMFGEAVQENIGIPRSVIVECGDCGGTLYCQIPVGIYLSQYVADHVCSCGGINLRQKVSENGVTIGPHTESKA